MDKDFDMKLVKALIEAEKIYLEELPSEEELENYHTFSDEFNIKMEKLINGERKKQWYRKLPFINNRVAAVFLVGLVVLAVSTFSVEAWRLKFFDYVLNIQEEYTEIKFNKTDEYVERKDNELVIYKPEYIPKGYEITDEETLHSMYIAEYKNAEDKYLIFHQYTLEGTGMQIDTEGTTLEDITINGSEGYFYHNKGYNNILWNDGYYGFMISGEISKEDIFKIAESVVKGQ